MLQSLASAPHSRGSERIEAMKPHLIVRLGLVCLLTILAVSAAAADQSTAGPD